MPTFVSNASVSGYIAYEGAGNGVLGENGTASITNPIVEDDSLILLSVQSVIGTVGVLQVANIDPEVGFDVISTNPLDRSEFVYIIFKPHT